MNMLHEVRSVLGSNIQLEDQVIKLASQYIVPVNHTSVETLAFIPALKPVKKQMTKTIVLQSDKWSNVQFNLRKLVLGLPPATASVADVLTDGLSTYSGSLAIMAGLAIWAVLSDARKIILEEPHSEFVKTVANVAYHRMPFRENHFGPLKRQFQRRQWDIDAVINDLEKLRVIKVYDEPFRIELRERLIIEGK